MSCSEHSSQSDSDVTQNYKYDIVSQEVQKVAMNIYRTSSEEYYTASENVSLNSPPSEPAFVFGHSDDQVAFAVQPTMNPVSLAILGSAGVIHMENPIQTIHTPTPILLNQTDSDTDNSSGSDIAICSLSKQNMIPIVSYTWNNDLHSSDPLSSDCDSDCSYDFLNRSITSTLSMCSMIYDENHQSVMKKRCESVETSGIDVSMSSECSRLTPLERNTMSTCSFRSRCHNGSHGSSSSSSGSSHSSSSSDSSSTSGSTVHSNDLDTSEADTEAMSVGAGGRHSPSSSSSTSAVDDQTAFHVVTPNKVVIVTPINVELLPDYPLLPQYLFPRVQGRGFLLSGDESELSSDYSEEEVPMRIKLSEVVTEFETLANLPIEMVEVISEESDSDSSIKSYVYPDSGESLKSFSFSSSSSSRSSLSSLEDFIAPEMEPEFNKQRPLSRSSSVSSNTDIDLDKLLKDIRDSESSSLFSISSRSSLSSNDSSKVNPDGSISNKSTPPSSISSTDDEIPTMVIPEVTITKPSSSSSNADTSLSDVSSSSLDVSSSSSDDSSSSSDSSHHSDSSDDEPSVEVISDVMNLEEVISNPPFICTAHVLSEVYYEVLENLPYVHQAVVIDEVLTNIEVLASRPLHCIPVEIDDVTAEEQILGNLPYLENTILIEDLITEEYHLDNTPYVQHTALIAESTIHEDILGNPRFVEHTALMSDIVDQVEVLHNELIVEPVPITPVRVKLPTLPKPKVLQSPEDFKVPPNLVDLECGYRSDDSSSFSSSSSSSSSSEDSSSSTISSVSSTSPDVSSSDLEDDSEVVVVSDQIEIYEHLRNEPLTFALGDRIIGKPIMFQGINVYPQYSVTSEDSQSPDDHSSHSTDDSSHGHASSTSGSSRSSCSDDSSQEQASSTSGSRRSSCSDDTVVKVKPYIIPRVSLQRPASRESVQDPLIYKAIDRIEKLHDNKEPKSYTFPPLDRAGPISSPYPPPRVVSNPDMLSGINDHVIHRKRSKTYEDIVDLSEEDCSGSSTCSSVDVKYPAAAVIHSDSHDGTSSGSSLDSSISSSSTSDTDSHSDSHSDRGSDNNQGSIVPKNNFPAMERTEQFLNNVQPAERVAHGEGDRDSGGDSDQDNMVPTKNFPAMERREQFMNKLHPVEHVVPRNVPVHDLVNGEVDDDSQSLSSLSSGSDSSSSVSLDQMVDENISITSSSDSSVCEEYKELKDEDYKPVSDNLSKLEPSVYLSIGEHVPVASSESDLSSCSDKESKRSSSSSSSSPSSSSSSSSSSNSSSTSSRNSMRRGSLRRRPNTTDDIPQNYRSELFHNQNLKSLPLNLTSPVVDDATIPVADRSFTSTLIWWRRLRDQLAQTDELNPDPLVMATPLMTRKRYANSLTSPKVTKPIPAKRLSIGLTKKTTKLRLQQTVKQIMVKRIPPHHDLNNNTLTFEDDIPLKQRPVPPRHQRRRTRSCSSSSSSSSSGSSISMTTTSASMSFDVPSYYSSESVFSKDDSVFLESLNNSDAVDQLFHRQSHRRRFTENFVPEISPEPTGQENM